MRALSSLEGDETQVNSLFTYFNNDEEIALAVIIQNQMHPKNSNRTDAIKNGAYVEIETVEQAQTYLRAILSK